MATEKQRRELQQWEGVIVDGAFRLDQYLGEGESGAVFRTDFNGSAATIKLIPAKPVQADAQLASWDAASKLNHPNLVRIYASGRSALDDTSIVYLVTEHADETMADVLAERRLTPTEARDVMATALDALAYLHGQGLSHGHIKASNFLAVGDDLKLSVDHVAASDPAEDVRMLGALFQNAIEKPLPQPFLDITERALDPNPRTRWTVPEIITRLDGRMPVRAAEPKPPVWRYVLPTAAIVIAAITFVIARSARHPLPAPPPAVAQTAPQPAPVAPAPAVDKKSAPEPAPPAKSAAERKRRTKSERRAATKVAQVTTQGIISQPMPEVPAPAIRTIHGKVAVPIRVDVDTNGNVIDAKVDGRSGSRYFAGYALKAARQWKFAPSGAPQSWVLRFVFTRENTLVSPARVTP